MIVILGALLRGTVPARGCVGRLGGEEFAVLLPGSSAEAARALAETVRHRFTELASLSLGSDLRPTVSFGITEVAAGEPIASALARADTLLYVAKREGRDRIVCDPDARAEGSDVPPRSSRGQPLAPP